MKHRLYRIIGWLCIIAHLNLIMPPVHAMDLEDAKAVHITHLAPKAALQDEQDLQCQSLAFNSYNLWETITSRGASFLVSEIAPLTIGILYDDPISYGFYKIAQAVLDINLQSKNGLLRFARNDNSGYYNEERKRKSNPETHELNAKLNSLKDDLVAFPVSKSITTILKETSTDVIEVCQAIVPSRSLSLQTSLKLMPLLFPMMRTVAINGGAHLNTSYEELCCGWILAQNATAPFLVDLDPNQTIRTSFEYGLYNPNTSYPVGSKDWETMYVALTFQIRWYIQQHPDSMIASFHNLTRVKGAFPTALALIEATAETFKDFLLGYQTWFCHCDSILATFNYYTIDNESLINGSRIYYPLNPPTPIGPPTPYDPSLALGLTFGIPFGVVGVCLLTALVVRNRDSIGNCIRSSEYTEIEGPPESYVSNRRSVPLITKAEDH